MLKKSLANTDRNYVVLQARKTLNGFVKIQGKGTEMNRDYGVSAKFINSDMSEYLGNITPNLKSLAETSKMYSEVQAVMNKGYIHFQIAGPAGNRDYGFATEISTNEVTSEVSSFIKEELDLA